MFEHFLKAFSLGTNAPVLQLQCFYFLSKSSLFDSSEVNFGLCALQPPFGIFVEKGELVALTHDLPNRFPRRLALAKSVATSGELRKIPKNEVSNRWDSSARALTRMRGPRPAAVIRL